MVQLERDKSSNMDGPTSYSIGTRSVDYELDQSIIMLLGDDSERYYNTGSRECNNFHALFFL